MKRFVTPNRLLILAFQPLTKMSIWSASAEHVGNPYTLKEKMRIDGGTASRLPPHRARHRDCAPRSSQRHPATTTYSKHISNEFLSQKLQRFYCGVQKVPKIMQNENRHQIHVCIEIPIVTEYEKIGAYFGRFSSLWDLTNAPRHSLRSPVTTNTFVT